MIVTYKLENKPTFTDGQMVDVDMSHLGLSGIRRVEIIGRGSIHIIDMWIVKFDTQFSDLYPFRALTVPHTSIVHFCL